MMTNELMNEQVEEMLLPIGETEDMELGDKIVSVKFVCPMATWYVVEYCPDQQTFYGFVENLALPNYSAWGYFTLSELEELQENPPMRSFFLKREEDFEPKKAEMLEGVDIEG